MKESKRTSLKVAKALLLTAPLIAILLAELGVRAAGVEPWPWPVRATEKVRRFPGIAVDPLLGPLPRPGWSGRWFDEFEVEVDERGFRSSGLPPPDSPEATIAFLGDSCTFGWGVDSEETFIARLDAMQGRDGPARFALLNGAYPGNSSVVGLYQLRQRIAPLKPDWVVLAFSANNAFRFATFRDADRFRGYTVRRFALRSRLAQIVLSWVANARAARGALPQKARVVVDAMPLDEIRRVASPAEFEDGLRRSIREARDDGARVALLLLPRASEVSDEYGDEDAARLHRADALPPSAAGSEPSPRERAMMEFSCLDPRSPGAVDQLHEGLRDWSPVRPARVEHLRRPLARGARAFVAGDLAAADSTFTRVLQIQPTSPIAHYDLGVTKIESGEVETGLRHLDRADQLACNVFLQYQVLVRKIAVDLDVPVIDAVLLFQAHEAEPLFLDPAHPSVRGHEVIAEELWRFFSANTR